MDSADFNRLEEGVDDLIRKVENRMRGEHAEDIEALMESYRSLQKRYDSLKEHHDENFVLFKQNYRTALMNYKVVVQAFVCLNELYEEKAEDNKDNTHKDFNAGVVEGIKLSLDMIQRCNGGNRSTMENLKEINNLLEEHDEEYDEDGHPRS